MIVGVGIDLTPVDRMERAMARHPGRFEARVFTDEERRYCRERARPAEHFAGRFAAKEATLKALGVPEGLSWHEMEIVPAAGPSTRPEVRLSGVAAEAARRLGVARLHVSITHAGGQATAVVIAEAR